MTRSTVPKYIEKGEGEVPKGVGTNNPMNFKKGNARKWRPDTGKKITKFRT